MMQDLSIAVILHNGSSRFEQVLDSLALQMYPVREIIIADVSMQEVASRIIESYRTRLPLIYLNEMGRTASVARNRAVAASSGSVLAFLDANCVPSRTWTEVIMRTFAELREIHVLQGNTSQVHGKHAWHSPSSDVINGHAGILSEHNWAIRGNLIRRFRMPFDERLKANEVVEFCWKLRQEGVRIAFSEEMEVWRHPNGSFASLLTHSYRNGVGRGQVKKLQDDYWDRHYGYAKSAISALSWVFRGTNNTQSKERSFDSTSSGNGHFSPSAVMQRAAFMTGVLRGRRSRMPKQYRVTPADLQVVVTNKCELRCIHCYYHANLERTSREMNAVDVTRIVESLNHDLRTVALVGGEPFLCSDLAEICRVFSEKIHTNDVYIMTNGFDTARIRRGVENILERANFDLYVRVSLDGMADTHNRIRGSRHSFRNALETVRSLQGLSKERERLRVEIQTTIIKDNFEEIETLAKFVANDLQMFQALDVARDIGMCRDNPGFMWTAYGPPDTSVSLTSEQFERAERHIRSIYKRHFAHTSYDPYQIDYQMKLVAASCRQPLLKKRLIRCRAGESMVTIFENYDVSICELTQPIGNLVDFNFNLRRLLEERFSTPLRDMRDGCYCSNPCFNSSSIKSEYLGTAWHLS